MLSTQVALSDDWRKVVAEGLKGGLKRRETRRGKMN